MISPITEIIIMALLIIWFIGLSIFILSKVVKEWNHKHMSAEDREADLMLYYSAMSAPSNRSRDDDGKIITYWKSM